MKMMAGLQIISFSLRTKVEGRQMLKLMAGLQSEFCAGEERGRIIMTMETVSALQRLCFMTQREREREREV